MIKDKVMKAYNYAQKAHKGQQRKFTNLPYFSHPKYVARLIEDLTSDPDMVVSSLLHDIIEDTDTTIEDIYKEFGYMVGGLVGELTSDKPENISKSQYLYTKIKGMSTKALIIKLADRLHNIQFLETDGVPRDFIEKYVRETNYIFKDLIVIDRVPQWLIDRVMQLLKKRIMENVEWLCFRYKIDLENQISI